MDRFDVIVIGGGVLGTFHAYHALEQGKKVLLLEKDLRPQQSTVRNFGQVVPSGMPVGEWLDYGRYSTQLYKSIQSETNIGIRNNGSCYIASRADEMAVLEEMHQKFKDVDYSSELLTKDAVLAKYPTLKSDYAVGALFFEQEVSAESEVLIHNIHKYIQDKYEQLTTRFNCAAVQVNVVNDSCEVVVADGTVYSAEHCFICNGRDFKILFPQVFADSGVVVAKLNMMSTKPMKEVSLPGNILTGLTIRRYESFQTCDAHKALDPNDVDAKLRELGVHILFKQRVDGSIILGDSHEYADAAGQDELSDFYNEMYINELMLAEAKKIMDLPNWEIEKVWPGFYAQHNEKDIFTETIDDRIHIVTGIGGKGMTTSAGFAKKNIESVL